MPASIRSFCTPHAAPRTDFGTQLTSLQFAVFTCARKPQKSQITSAHLKFVGSCLSVRVRLHFGQRHCFTTMLSPAFPSAWCFVAMFALPLRAAGVAAVDV